VYVSGPETTAETVCAGCGHVFAEGDRYIADAASGFIADAASGFIGKDADLDVDGLVAGIFGNADGKVRFCADCTEPGGTYVFETFSADGCT
jgi:hypothetical protein